MESNGLPRIHLVLLIRDPETLESLGAPLWSMFDEVEKLYNLKRPLGAFSRTCVTPEAPPRPARIAPDELVRPDQDEWGKLWQACCGSLTDTIDPECLTRRLSRILQRTPRRLDRAVVVTDQEITPPKQRRYALWRRSEDATVVSTALMDPEYWGIKDRSRHAMLKHRVRASCMCVVGTELGLARCDNEQCYLFRRIDSVLRLDLMRTIGREHAEYPVEEPVGYFVHKGDPAVGQEVASAEDLQVQGWRRL